MGRFKKIISTVLIVIFIFTSTSLGLDTKDRVEFQDVPENHWAYKLIHDLRLLNITDGIGDNQFGMGLTIKRSEFVAFLVKLMNLELVNPQKGSFKDNMNSAKWYYAPIETALKQGIILNDEETFRVNDPITREEMAIMIIRALGYSDLANGFTDIPKPFEDVSENMGYITLARDFDIINGVGNNMFSPYATAKREEAAAMMMRMYEKLNSQIEELHGFYAIKSVNQSEMIKSLDSIGFGWSRLEYDTSKDQVVLNTTKNNDNEYGIPEGFSEPLTIANKNNVTTQIMVTTQNTLVFDNDKETEISLNEYILTNNEVRKKVINEIVAQVNTTTVDDITMSFDGVVIDFENMKGEVLKQAFNVFLKELKQELKKEDKQLYVAVHPKRKSGQAYYDGYDYKTIGDIADRVILMAHDYYARQLTDSEMNSGYTLTPLTPIDEIYYALKYITDKASGVEDLSKISLQISFDSVQWKLKEGKVINKYPYNPSYEAIIQRFIGDEATIDFSNLNGSPYVSFFDDKDQTQNILWYENEDSISDKINLAKMFGVKGISLWRLGNIPDYEDIDSKNLKLNVWKTIYLLK